MTNLMNCDEVEELMGAYVLGALPPESLSDIGEHLLTCVNHPDAAELGAVASSLALVAPEREPPLALKARIMDAVHKESSAVPAVRRRGILDRLRRLKPELAVPYALAGALAVALLVVVLSSDGGPSEPRTSVITLTGEGDARAVVHVLEDGLITMEAAGLQPLTSDQTYQVWAIESGQPESLGFLAPAGDGEALGAMRADLSSVDVLAVTIEPAGGSPQPTTTPILAAEV
jgi:anti-sigma-K factor RskA